MKFIMLIFIFWAVMVPSSYGELYKWVDEKGTVHFTDDLSSIPVKYRHDAETRKPPKEISTPQLKEEPKSIPPQKISENTGITVALVRKHEFFLEEVVLSGGMRQQL